MITNYDVSKIENYEELRKLQLTQLEILKFVSEFCDKNNLKYSIAYGTLLGAVRHGGFIPWDDDLDICMPREDYNKFIELWKDTDMYLLQNHDTEPEFTQSFTKIRKKNTAFIQTTDLGLNYHKGIFIDIFPFDKVPDSKIKKMTQFFDATLFNLYTRGYIPAKSNVAIRLISKFFLAITPKKSYMKKAKKYLNKISKYSKCENLSYADMSCFGGITRYHDKDIFCNMNKIKFEDSEFSVFNNYIECLAFYYGDYMKLPPEKEQTWFHHPICIDFEKEYGEFNYE